jgi:MFS family permease
MLTTVMFLVSFTWSFVYVELPFYIERLSTLGPGPTLAWTGWILGITSLVSVAATPVWGRYAARHDLRAVLVVMQVLQALGFLAAAFADSLPELFAARFVLGAIGASSTLAFMLAGREPDLAERRRRLAAIQSANVLGTVLGPLASAVAASRLGFRLSFGLGALVLAGCAALVQWRMASATAESGVAVARHRLPVRAVALTAVVVLVGASQEAFLTAILPNILPGLGVRPAATIEAGGMLVFVSGAAAALGGLAAPRLVEEVPQRRLLPVLLVGSSLGLIAFGAAGALWLYTLLRIVQALCIAPLFPLLVIRMARHGGGEAIGILNAARAGGNFAGPVVATSLLTWGSPAVVYVLLGLAGFAVLPLLEGMPGHHRRRAARG